MGKLNVLSRVSVDLVLDLEIFNSKELYFQVERQPSLCRFQQISNEFNFSFEFTDVFLTL